MKLKPLITTLLIVLTFFDGLCQKGISQNETFELSGEITNDYAGYLYLEYGNKIDSAFIENKTFSFAGKVDYPIESKLITKDGHANPFYLENSKMTRPEICIHKTTSICIKTTE